MEDDDEKRVLLIINQMEAQMGVGRTETVEVSTQDIQREYLEADVEFGRPSTDQGTAEAARVHYGYVQRTEEVSMNESANPERALALPEDVGNMTGLFPHGVNLTDMPLMQEILNDRPELYAPFTLVFRGRVAASTTKTYSWVTRDFSMFCRCNDYAYPQFTTYSVLVYLANCVVRQRTYAFYRMLGPALLNLEKTLGRGKQDSRLTELVWTGISSLKRLAAEYREPVKKAVPFGLEELKIMIDHVVYKNEQEGKPIPVGEYRSLVRAISVFYSWMRFSDWNQITDKMVEDKGDYIRIFIPRSKNDPFFAGSHSYIPQQGGKYCPCYIIRHYFKCYKLTFKYEGPVDRFLNFRIVNYQGTHYPLLTRSLAYTTAMDQMRNLLQDCGLPGALYTECSFKCGGVTAFIHSGNSLEETMVSGRWHSKITPLFYLRENDEWRVKLSKKIPRI